MKTDNINNKGNRDSLNSGNNFESGMTHTKKASRPETRSLKVKLCRDLIIRLIAFSAVYSVIIFLGRFVFVNQISNFLYMFFDYRMYNTITSFIYMMVPVVWILCCCLIIYHTISEATKCIEALTSSIDILISKDNGYITLPPSLKTLESTLNQLKYNTLASEHAARDSEQRKNDLVVYLAHDIRTPLTSVIGYLSLLDEANDMPELQREKYTRIALDKAFHLERLVNEFFEITRYNFQSIVLEKEDINLSLMLAQQADEFFPVLEAESKSIRINAPDDLKIYADPDKLGRVFNNIIKNAISYSHPNTVITLSAEISDGQIIVKCTNRGKQISPEKLETIFEKFYRGDNSRTTGTGGSGLGLAIAKEITKRHGGTVTAESNADFTVFTVVLPQKH